MIRLIRQSLAISLGVLLLLAAAVPLYIFAQPPAFLPSEEKIVTDTGYAVFKIGDKNVLVKGSNVVKFAPELKKTPATVVEGATVITMDAAPYIENDRTFVPVRYLANALGVADANVKWEEGARLITLAEPGFPTVEMTLGEKRIISNGKATATDVAPVIRSDRTMLPAKYVAEALGYTVEWDAATKTVLAYRGEKPPKEELEKVYKEFATLKNPQVKAPATGSVPVKKVPIAAGGGHSLALKSDGTVWAWGDGRSTPVQVKGLTAAVAIAAGGGHSLALKSDGTVWAWGDNLYGQLGDGTREDRTTPVRVRGLTNAVAIATGSYHSLALKSDGTVWAWGNNLDGQLGNGRSGLFEKSVIPVQVKGLTNVVAIAAGGDHSLALKSDGTVWAWGDGRSTPLQVQGLTDVVAIAAGGGHSLALKSDGTVWAWGGNGWGQLGDGTTENRTTAVQVWDLTDVVAIAAGGDHSLALKSDGTVWAWGNNLYGQLGDGTTTWFRPISVQVQDLTDVVAIAASSDAYSASFSLAVKRDGTVWAWGRNGDGQLGDGTKTDRLTPVQVQGLTGVVTSGF